ncbi:MAG TPA: cytochrome c biogenesis protein CcdA [Rectinemataceae bacterium]|nr:cytochrome c biogenesis protein CcdA [Rectinemataceae bacterium]
MREVGLLTAAAAGLLSFLSPCILPLIPGYLSFISGYALADIRTGAGRFRILARTLVFVLGFTLVFAVLGIIFSGASIMLGGLSRTITLVAGALIVVLGLNLIFDFIKVLNMEARVHAAKAPRGYLGAFALGLAFAAGWSPCIGPILASILLYAAREGNTARSALLLAAYSAGLALPFLAAGLFFDRMRRPMDWFKRHALGVKIVSGALLIALGAGMALGQLGRVSSLAPQAGLALKEFAIRAPGQTRAAGALLWIILAALILALPLLRRGKILSPPRVVLAAAMVVLAAGDAAGLWSTVHIVSSWLLFQGV